MTVEGVGADSPLPRGEGAEEGGQKQAHRHRDVVQEVVHSRPAKEGKYF